jgi:hypothetical protein
MTAEASGIESINAGDLFKELIWSALKSLILSRIAALVPFLVWGPVGVVTGFVVGKVLDLVYDAIGTFLALEGIRFKNESLQREFDSSSLKLKLIARDKGINSPEFLLARDEHKKKLSEFVKIGG